MGSTSKYDAYQAYLRSRRQKQIIDEWLTITKKKQFTNSCLLLIQLNMIAIVFTKRIGCHLDGNQFFRLIM